MRRFVTVQRIRLGGNAGGAGGAATVPQPIPPFQIPVNQTTTITTTTRDRVPFIKSGIAAEPFVAPRSDISLNEITRFDNNFYYSQLLSEAVNLHFSSIPEIQSYLVVYQEVNQISTEYQDLLALLFYKKTELTYHYNLMDQDNVFKLLRDELVQLPLFEELGISTINSIEVGDFKQQMLVINRQFVFSIYDAQRDKKVARVTYFSSRPTTDSERRANIQSSSRQRQVEGTSSQFKTLLAESPRGATILSIIDFIIQKFAYTFITLQEDNAEAM